MVKCPTKSVSMSKTVRLFLFPEDVSCGLRFLFPYRSGRPCQLWFEVSLPLQSVAGGRLRRRVVKCPCQLWFEVSLPLQKCQVSMSVVVWGFSSLTKRRLRTRRPRGSQWARLVILGVSFCATNKMNLLFINQAPLCFVIVEI